MSQENRVCEDGKINTIVKMLAGIGVLFFMQECVQVAQLAGLLEIQPQDTKTIIYED